jgi:hypothetical protein
MSLDFCTWVTRNARRFGYETKVARRIAKFCYLAMTFLCGLFGLLERMKAQIYPIADSGIMHTAGTRAGTISPAFSPIRR